jgi:DNA repair exonuclease SbcCD ATPase subunit
MAVEKNIKINVDAKGAVQEVDKLKQGVKDTNKAAANSEGSFGKMKRGIGAVGMAFKAVGIGLIVAAFAKLAEIFSQNQVIMDKVAVRTAILGDIIQKLIQPIIEVVKGLGLLGKAVSKVLKGEFKEAGQIAKQAFDGVKDSIVGNNESFSDFIKNAKESAKETVKYAKDLVRLQNEVKLAEANQRQLQLTYQKDAEIQRQLRDDISLTFEERIAANEELGRILDEQFAEEQALAQKKVELAELELSRNKTNIDLQVALINAKTELADLDERITGQRSEQLTNLKALEKEKADADQAIVDQKIAEQKKLTDTEREEAKKREQIAEAERAMKIGLAKGIIGSLGQLAGEGTKAAKAAALAQVMIDTASGISSAIAGATAAAAAAGPAAPIVTPILIAQLVGQVLAGVATAKGILKKVPGPDETIPDNVDIPAGSTGGFSGFGGLVPNIDAITPPGTTTPPVQAFVVENDISDAQALQEELEIQATL